MEDEHEKAEEDDGHANDQDDDGAVRTQDQLMAAGLEDSDAEDDMVHRLRVFLHQYTKSHWLVVIFHCDLEIDSLFLCW